MTMDPVESTRLKALTHVTLVGSVVDLVLGVLKIILGLMENSQALVADGIHSLSDLVTDAMVLVAVRQGNKSADEDHPYGHARIETITTVLLALALFLVSFGIVNQAVEVLSVPDRDVTPGWLALLVVMVSAISKEYIYHYTMKVAKLHQSPILEANAWHSRTDAFSSVMVFVGIGGAMLGLPELDAVAAIGVAIVIAKVAWDLGAPSVQELVDKGMDRSYLDDLEDAVREINGVKGFHELRTRRMGASVLVDVHIAVDSMITVSEGHQIAEQVRLGLTQQFREISDVVVHVDAEDDVFDDTLPERGELLEMLEQCWKEYPPAQNILRTNLHYLNGTIRLEVCLPFTVASSPATAREIAENLKSRAMEVVPQITRVQVLFAVDDD
ncbi:MAG: cation diffusion facilitator family transporter [Proteobacteria bacterium]|nr:cation diffusion facilitator family transporter [Pseudomonadota bacterium]